VIGSGTLRNQYGDKFSAFLLGDKKSKRAVTF